ncbi:MAG: PEP/pyruvate-binding domain-containing protein, partial [Myxococcota bacterium]|nr:PEP/pyruvate-binding domain-containing protein [Myxococcota bacterium]
MTAAGVAVPRGFVVTTEVFADVTAGKLSGFNESVSRIEASDLESLQGVSDMAREAIGTLELPDAVVSAVKTAHELLEPSGVAVRSSATAEDLPGTSFAGQYDSFLNVLSLPQIADSLLRVWASLYSVRAISYALSNGISFEKVRMAVVIQQQLHPHVSGVMFTQDPLTGADRLVVNAALGLGEGVVDGSMPADQFTVEPGNGKIIRSEVAAKETMMVIAPAGGTQRSPVPESQRSKPALSETRLEELAALGSRLTGLLGGPQDIEFAVADGEAQCLQARPITGVEQPEASTVDWESQVDGRYTWQPSRMRIHSGPMYRLQQDAVEAYQVKRPATRAELARREKRKKARPRGEPTGGPPCRDALSKALHGAELPGACRTSWQGDRAAL